MSKREWKAGPVNKNYLKKCRHAAGGTKTIHRKAAINKRTVVPDKPVYVPPPFKACE
jgi:hypothetical protein